MINPNDVNLIKEFLTYIEHEGEARGYILVDKGHWNNNSMFHRQIPKKGDKTIVRIKFELYRPTDEDIDEKIELFLKKRSKNK